MSAKTKGGKKTVAKVNLSGVGVTVGAMSDTQFNAHLSRVLNRMQSKGVSMEHVKAASLRVRARRAEFLEV